MALTAEQMVKEIVSRTLSAAQTKGGAQEMLIVCNLFIEVVKERKEAIESILNIGKK